MEKILLKKIGFIFVVLSILIFSLFSGIIFFTESKVAIHDLEEMVDQIEISYYKSKLDTETTTKIFEEDYLNRAYVVDSMLNNNSGVDYNVSTLKKIQELMKVDSIHIIDDTGEIVLSSEQESVGLNVKDDQESEVFVKLIESSDITANVVQLDGVGITDNEPKIYIGVKASSTKYSVIQIGLNANVLDHFIANNSIATITKNTPTVQEKALFIIDEKSGGIDGITQNNEQELRFENTDTKEEYLSILNSSTEGKLIKINGSLKLLKTKNIDDKIIGAYVDADQVYRVVLIQILCLLIGILIILICVIMILKYYLKRYVLKDISSIESSIKELMAGNIDVTFGTEYDTEFRHVTTVLNDWKDSYQSKTKRMTRVISSIDSHVAVFECLYSINQNFYSDNTQSILGIDDDAWDEITKSPKGFERYLTSLITHSEEDIITLNNNRFISIVSFNKENEFYGIIIDKTKDVKLKNRIQQELHAAQEEAEIDPLTNLTNRAGLEKQVKKSLENIPGKGTMIIFDLDNFKSVNDELGHPEGDNVLKLFAHCLKSCFRNNDVVARIGGDEFVVFIHSYVPVNVMSNELHTLLEDIRKELRDYKDRYGLSTSIGVAYVDKSINSYEDLYKCADVGLYIAKRLGKDGFYINEDNIRCTRDSCIRCTNDCKKRQLLGL